MKAPFKKNTYKDDMVEQNVAGVHHEGGNHQLFHEPQAKEDFITHAPDEIKKLERRTHKNEKGERT